MALHATGNVEAGQNIVQTIEPIAEALSGTERLVALTGAGISTESGIPDYRSPDGVWARHTPIYYSDFVGKPAVRRRYWARSLNGYGRFRDAQPNRGHLAMAALERAGRLHYLITQNVDRLHTKAGSKRVLELHGENSSVHCIRCSFHEPRTQTQARLEWDNRHLILPADETGDAEEVQVPLCPVCGGLLKPAVIFFGEPLRPEVVQHSLQLVEEGTAFLVVGSSLTVYSGYRLVRAARQAGKPVYVVNIGPTRADAEVTMKLEAPAGDTLAALARLLGAAL